MTNNDNTLALARSFIKTARGYAEYKRIIGYNEDNYDILDILNQKASLEICNRGPADYYYILQSICRHSMSERVR